MSVRIACAFLLLGTAFAIFAEEARTHWQHKNIGIPQNVVFHQKNAIVATDANVLASVSMRSGSISWRRELPCTVTTLALSATTLVTVCDSHHLFVWQTFDGSMVWDLPLSRHSSLARNSAVSEAVVVSRRDGDDIYVAVGGGVVALRDEAVAWTWSPTSTQQIARITLDATHAKAYGVVFNPSSPLAPLEFIDLAAYGATQATKQTSDNKDNDTAEVPSATTASPSEPLPSPPPVLILRKRGLVVRSKGSNLETSTLAPPHTTRDIKPADFASLNLPSDAVLSVLSVDLDDAFFLSTDGDRFSMSYVGQLGDDSRGGVVHNVLPDDTVHPSVPTMGNVFVASRRVAITRDTIDGSELTVAGEGEKFQQVIKSTNITKVFLQEFQKKGGGWAWRVLCVSDTGRVFALSHDTNNLSQLWSTEQSLAHISSVKMIVAHGKPLATEDESQFQRPSPADTAAMLLTTVSSVASTLLSKGPKYAFAIAKELEVRFGKVLNEGVGALTAPFPALDGPQQSAQQDIGVVVCLTRGGHLFGLSLSNGQVLWSLRSRVPSGLGAAGHVWKLFEPRKEGIHRARIATVLIQQDTTYVVWVDPLSGEEVGFYPIRVSALDAFLLPITDSHHTHLLAILDSSFKLHIVSPDGEVSQPRLPEFYHHMLGQHQQQHDQKTSASATNSDNSNSATIVGLGTSGGSQMQHTWQLAFPKSEEIVATHLRRKGLKTSSATRITLSRSLLHKYINPNLLVVATTAPKTAIEQMYVSVYFVDAVSGRILHHSMHPGCTKPVHIAVTDNDVAVAMWNANALANELVSFELFENRPEDGFLDALFGTMPVTGGLHNHTHYSSFSRHAPKVTSRQYLLPKPVVCLTSTETTRGIAAKQILAGLVSDQVWAIDRRFINPQQVAGTPTAEEREEQILQYQMIVPFSTMTVVSYNNTIMGLRGIETEPGVFESESLMFAYGTDVLFVPLRPSGPFDQLNEDFNRGLLVLAIVGLTSALLLAVSASRRKDLQRKWR